MTAPDRYGGAVAEGYEAHRRDRPPWAAEHAAVRALVTRGPVLDAPIGTGRFIEIYKEKHLDYVGVDLSRDMLAQARKKDPKADLSEGDVRSLCFCDDAFETAVCSRLLNWLDPPDMARALEELSRVARHLVISIRTGIEGLAGNFTHSYAKFLAAIGGLCIADRHLLQEVPSGVFEMFSLRRPAVSLENVFAQFGVGPDEVNCAVRMARVWTDHLGLPPLDWSNVTLTAAHVTHTRLASILCEMAQDAVIGGQQTQIITDVPPRKFDRPLTILHTRIRDVLLDGRRRANVWKDQPGRYLAYVVEAG